TEHPAIENAAVIGVPDERWGEQVGAVLRLRAGHERPGVEELTAFLRDRIAPHKTPVFWAVREALPLTASGKIQKFILREDLVKGLLVWDEVRMTGEPDGAGLRV
ncbi:MAG: hypothetical protein L0K86_28705, partial [Actinomycetia bacterium]|nr:hypothetical protein [Actinomycetes bacterium]